MQYLCARAFVWVCEHVRACVRPVRSRTQTYTRAHARAHAHTHARTQISRCLPEWRGRRCWRCRGRSIPSPWHTVARPPARTDTVARTSWTRGLWTACTLAPPPPPSPPAVATTSCLCKPLPLFFFFFFFSQWIFSLPFVFLFSS